MTGTAPPSAAVDALLPDLVRRFAEALARLRPDGGRLGLAVSGGPDSMAMLLLAHAAIPGEFEVATVDHGLRPEAADECALVEVACAERGIPCERLAPKVAPGNLQRSARDARYAALGSWAERRGLDAIATAHHADDQTETVIMRLNRGSGLSGLAGIRSVRVLDEPTPGIWVIRPLLLFRRSELSALITAHDLVVAHDPSNDDASFDRVRIRQALAEVGWLDPIAVARSAQNLEDANGALELHIEALARTEIKQRGNAIYFNPIMHPYCAMRLVKIAIQRFGGNPRGGEIARLIDGLWSGQPGNLAGVLVTNEQGRWTFRPEPPRRS